MCDSQKTKLSIEQSIHRSIIHYSFYFVNKKRKKRVMKITMTMRKTYKLRELKLVMTLHDMDSLLSYCVYNSMCMFVIVFLLIFYM